MPRITIPSKPKQWNISYMSDYIGDIINSQNISMDNPFGAPCLPSGLIPHTVTQNISAIGVPTDFQRANIDGTDSYFAAAEVLYRVSLSSFFGGTHFAADSITLSPTAIVDGDIALFGKTVGSNPGRDIMVISSQGTNLSFYNADDNFATPAWRQDWWTGKVSLISSISIATPQAVNTTSAHGYSTGDYVLIQGPVAQPISISSSTNTTPITINTSGSHGFQTGDTVVIANHTVNTNANGTWVITQTSSSAFTLNGSTGNGIGSSTGTATESDPGFTDRVFIITVTSSTQFTIIDTLGNEIPHGYSLGGSSYRIFDSTLQESALGQLPLASGIAHPMLTFGNAPDLFILDGNSLHSIDGPITPFNINTPSVGDYRDYQSVDYKRVVFKTGYTGNWIAATPYKIYVGLKNTLDSSAPSLVEEYDPFAEQVREFTIDEGMTIGYVQDDNLFIVNNQGEIKSFNGSGFDTFTNFPSAYNTSTITLHRNGILPFGRYTAYLIQSVSDGISLVGGVWVYSPDGQFLYHRNGPMVYNSSQITYGSPSVPLTGALGYLSGYSAYFAGLQTAQTGALNSQGIWISGSIAPNGAGDNRGFFITSKISAPDIDAVWRNFLIKYNMNFPKFGTQNSTIVVKYRTSNATYSIANERTGTWNSSTTLTDSGTIPSGVNIGDEVWIVTGNGAGATAHISLIASANTVITLDEPILSAPTGSFNYVIDNWHKIAPPITDATRQHYLTDITTSLTEFIQFKVELRESSSAGPIIEELQVGTQPNLVVEK